MTPVNREHAEVIAADQRDNRATSRAILWGFVAVVAYLIAGAIVYGGLLDQMAAQQ